MFSNYALCPLCGKEFKVSDNTKYGIVICPRCHQTVFEGSNSNNFNLLASATSDQSVSAGG